MKMFDSSLLFEELSEELSTKWTKNTQKCPKQREAQHIC